MLETFPCSDATRRRILLNHASRYIHIYRTQGTMRSGPDTARYARSFQSHINMPRELFQIETSMLWSPAICKSTLTSGHHCGRPNAGSENYQSHHQRITGRSSAYESNGLSSSAGMLIGSRDDVIPLLYSSLANSPENSFDCIVKEDVI